MHQNAQNANRNLTEMRNIAIYNALHPNPAPQKKKKEETFKFSNGVSVFIVSFQVSTLKRFYVISHQNELFKR